PSARSGASQRERGLHHDNQAILAEWPASRQIVRPVKPKKERAGLQKEGRPGGSRRVSLRSASPKRNEPHGQAKGASCLACASGSSGVCSFVLTCARRCAGRT